jgi:DNA-binding HxlR family transcriptional regulator
METTKPKTRGRGDVTNSTCPSRGVLELIADKWTVLIIHTLERKTMRHNELARALGGISQKVLTQGLRKLERSGIIMREVYPVVPPRVEYSLTPLGRSLIGVLGTLSSWAENHFPEVERARERFDTSEKD